MLAILEDVTVPPDLSTKMVIVSGVDENGSGVTPPSHYTDPYMLSETSTSVPLYTTLLLCVVYVYLIVDSSWPRSYLNLFPASIRHCLGVPRDPNIPFSDWTDVTAKSISVLISDDPDILVSIHCVPVPSRYSIYASYMDNLSLDCLPTSICVLLLALRSNTFFIARKFDICC